MKNKKMIMGFLTLIVLMILIPTRAHAVQDVLDSEYYFSSDGIMSLGDGTVRSDIFTNILRTKEAEIIEAMKTLGEGMYSDNVLNGGLEVTYGDVDNLWDYDLNNLYSNTRHTTFIIRTNSSEYTVTIPRGQYFDDLDGDGKKEWYAVNQAEISATITSLEAYRNTVRKAILIGSMASSINVYTMIPDRQVPVSDVLTDPDNRGQVNLKASGVRMDYSLDYFFNPIFGKIDGLTLTKEGLEDYFKYKEKDIKITPLSKGQISFNLDEEYLAFIPDDSAMRKTLTETNATEVEKYGVSEFTSERSKKVTKPLHLVDTSMRVYVPYQFSTHLDSGKYTLDSMSSFKEVEGIRFQITHFKVYLDTPEGLQTLGDGDYETFGIMNEGLVLYHTYIGRKVNEYGDVTEEGKKVGIVIPLWYNEAIVDTTDGDKVYFTGRDVKLANDYSGKITLDGLNKDLFSVDTKTTGKMPEALRNFAFPSGSTHLETASHTSLTSKPTNFVVHIGFETNENGARGFVMFRNNWYVDDPELIQWLQSNEAKAMTDVDAEKLYKLITGVFSTGQKELTYQEWLRLQEIKQELDTSFSSRVLSAIRIITMVFGMLLVFYSTLLFLFYLFDIHNSLTEFSVLHWATFKRLYPIKSEDDIMYLSSYQGQVKFVSLVRMFLITLGGTAVGLLFIFSTPIIEFILYLYYLITNGIGV